MVLDRQTNRQTMRCHYIQIVFDENVAFVCNNGNLPLCKGVGQALANVDQRAFKDKRIRERPDIYMQI